jgi:hypothetical protein
MLNFKSIAIDRAVYHIKDKKKKKVLLKKKEWNKQYGAQLDIIITLIIVAQVP